jgi:site-specific recombinase XerD
MIVMERQHIHDAVSAIMGSLSKQGTSPSSLKTYETSFNSFLCYLEEEGIGQVDEKMCLEYIFLKTGRRFESFECVTADTRVDYRMRPLLLLIRYLEEGQFRPGVRSIKPKFVCPSYYKAAYEAFCEELAYCGYSQATIDSSTQKVQRLIGYLSGLGISIPDITIAHIEGFLKTLEGKGIKYVSLFLYAFRKFFAFLYERGFADHYLVALLPKVRTPRQTSVPYVWSKDDLQKLLGAIDRADPKGKRDYAILLLAIRLGLRIGDIRNLMQSSIDWARDMIRIKMAKTGQYIELPLLRDVGWAIIDYLKNGRPQTTSECLFVRHKAPFNAFGRRCTFYKELHRYVLKAGLTMPDDQRHGMHSLRSTLAVNMLEVKSPLPVISETLGHQSVNTTGIYLRVDIEGLRKCAIDPEEVFCDEGYL